jgi:hypothetical protein
MKNDLELIIKKYNELNEKYCNLINKKLLYEDKKTISVMSNKSNILLNNIRSRLSNRLKGVILNYPNLKNYNTINNNSISHHKIKKFNNKETKSIQIKPNKNEKSNKNDLIHSLKKENEMLKRIVITYKRLNNKKSLLTKEKIHYNIREQRLPEDLKNSFNKNNSKEHSLKSKMSSKDSKNKIINKSPILFVKEKVNNSLSQNKNSQIINDSSLLLAKNKKWLKNKKVFNTINNYSHNMIRKHNTYVNNILKLESKNNIIKKKFNNKFKTKRKELLLNDKYNSKSISNSNNISKEKNINKFTPKKESKNSESFFIHTNYNIKDILKKNNILNSTNKLDLGKKFINLKPDNIKNNTIRNYFHKNKSNNIESVNLFKRINTESNNDSHNNTNIINKENKDHKLGNKYRLMKDYKTEEENMTEKTISSKKIKIDRNKIFLKNSDNSFQDSLILKKKVNEISDKNNHSIIKKKLKLEIKNKNLIINNINKYKKNKLLLNFDNEKIIGKNFKLSTIMNNKVKTQNNTINNISNFNNCNYIYLFNNGEKKLNN